MARMCEAPGVAPGEKHDDAGLSLTGPGSAAVAATAAAPKRQMHSMPTPDSHDDDDTKVGATLPTGGRVKETPFPAAAVFTVASSSDEVVGKEAGVHEDTVLQGEREQQRASLPSADNTSAAPSSLKTLLKALSAEGGNMRIGNGHSSCVLAGALSSGGTAAEDAPGVCPGKGGGSATLATAAIGATEAGVSQPAARIADVGILGTNGDVSNGGVLSMSTTPRQENAADRAATSPADIATSADKEADFKIVAQTDVETPEILPLAEAAATQTIVSRTTTPFTLDATTAHYPVEVPNASAQLNAGADGVVKKRNAPGTGKGRRRRSSAREARRVLEKEAAQAAQDARAAAAEDGDDLTRVGSISGVGVGLKEGPAEDVCEEDDEGNVEYKLKLVDPPLDRLEHLFTQVGTRFVGVLIQAR